MPMISIDGEEYDTDSLSDETKAQLGSLQFVDAEINRLRAQMAALQTARNAYGKALKESLTNGATMKNDEVSIEGLEPNLKFD